jgi:hypothetical protein
VSDVGLTPREREAFMERYASAPARLRQALSAVSPEAMQWRPAPDEFSLHEIVCHPAETALLPDEAWQREGTHVVAPLHSGGPATHL